MRGTDVKKNDKDQQSAPVNALAALSIGVLVFSFGLAKSGWVTPGVIAWLIALAAVLGALVLVGTIESALRTHVLQFYGLRYACLSAFAIAVYVARINGINDINAIFHVDPGALPLTIWVATIANMFKLLQISFVGGLLVSLYLVLDRANNWSGCYETKDWLRWLTSAGAFGLLLFIVFARLGTDQRAQFLYRIAEETDFVSSFRCQGIDQQGVVGLFIGPDQRRILLAPVINDLDFTLREVPRLFKPVKIPKEFPTLDCVAPPVDMKDWRRENVSSDNIRQVVRG